MVPIHVCVLSVELENKRNQFSSRSPSRVTVILSLRLQSSSWWLGCQARVSDFASSLGSPVCTGLKKMKGLAPHPWTVTQPTGQSLKWMRVCVWGGVFGTILHYLNMLGDLRTTHEAYNRGRWTAPRVSSLVSLNILSMGGTPRAYTQHRHTHTSPPRSRLLSCYVTEVVKGARFLREVH
jgi:hypothetical protein